MKVLFSQFLDGPNLYCSESVVVVSCDFTTSPEVLAWMAGPGAADPKMPPPRKEITDSLRSLEAGWREASSTGKPPVGQLLHVALVLQREVLASPTLFGTILEASGSRVTAVLRCDVPAVGLAAWQMAVASGHFFRGLGETAAQSEGAEAELAARFAQFRITVFSKSLDQLSVALIREAGKRDIPWTRFAFPERYVQLGQGKHRRRMLETVVETTGKLAAKLTHNKAVTSHYLSRLAFPVPMQELVRSPEEAVVAASRIGYPVVVKPCHGFKGRGVSLNLDSEQKVRDAFRYAAKGDDGVVVESFVAGDDHRLLVVGGRLIAAARRIPAHVIGDGRSSVEALVRILNMDPRRGYGFEKVLELVAIDQRVTEVLADQGLGIRSVPAPGRTVWLGRIANIAQGGTAVDVTEAMHPDNVKLAEDVARVVGLDVTGIDFTCRDIGRSWREVGGGIIEVNANPGLRPHWAGDGGRRDVVGPILDLLFPGGASGRVPTAAITGSIGKTTTCRMVAHILAASGKRVGLSTTQGVYLDGTMLRDGDHAGGLAARNLLMHPDVEAGVFEMARGGLLKKGMFIDRFDVGAVLNVLGNHLGLDGVHTREQMARVKRIVVENSRELAVLNADDPLCLAMRPHLRSRRLCLVSIRPDHPEVRSHRVAGGCTVVIDGQGASARMMLAEGERELGAISVGEIPATLGGCAMSKVANAAFSIAIAHGLGVPFEVSAAALRGFDSTYEANPGRYNFHRKLPFDVMLDWVDGPEAATDLAATVARLPVTGQRKLLLTATGNRSDDFIIETGKAVSACFDHYTCSSPADLRGRNPGDVPELLRRGLEMGGVGKDRIRCVPNHEQALEETLGSAQPGDLLVVATYSTELSWKQITRHGAASKPATAS